MCAPRCTSLTARREYRKHKRPFSQIARVSTRRQGGLQFALRRDVGLNRSTRAAESPHAKAIFRPILSVGPSAALPAPSGSALVVWIGRSAVDQKKLACDGAREGGDREGSAEPSWRSGWVRILLITAGSSMQAMIRSAPRQCGR
jgi:hypothetical protein